MEQNYDPANPRLSRKKMLWQVDIWHITEDTKSQHDCCTSWVSCMQTSCLWRGWGIFSLCGVDLVLQCGTLQQYSLSVRLHDSLNSHLLPANGGLTGRLKGLRVRHTDREPNSQRGRSWHRQIWKKIFTFSNFFFFFFLLYFYLFIFLLLTNISGTYLLEKKRLP